MSKKATGDAPLKTLSERVPPAEPAVELDSVDVRLLTELSKDARIPQRQLAEILGMSSPAVADRIGRLKKRGVIRGFSVDIDWDRLGYSTVAYLSVVAGLGRDQGVVLSRLLEIRGVEEVTVVTGGSDMLVRVRARGFDDLRWILANEIWPIPGLQKTDTSIAFLRLEPEGGTERMLAALSRDED